MRRRWGAFFLGAVAAVVLTWVVPALALKLYHWRFPTVGDDWVKARCYEYRRDGAGGVGWENVGPDRWYFRDERFGARRLELEGRGVVLIIGPEVDGPRAYALLPDGSIRYSPDDAISMGCDWTTLNGANATDAGPHPNQIGLDRWHELK